jgi:hypothetical protein
MKFGPWTLLPPELSRSKYRVAAVVESPIDRRCPEMVALVYGGSPSQPHPNARLIAEAPTLLEAWRDALPLFKAETECLAESIRDPATGGFDEEDREVAEEVERRRGIVALVTAALIRVDGGEAT